MRGPGAIVKFSVCGLDLMYYYARCSRIRSIRSHKIGTMNKVNIVAVARPVTNVEAIEPYTSE